MNPLLTIQKTPSRTHPQVEPRALPLVRLSGEPLMYGLRVPEFSREGGKLREADQSANNWLANNTGYP